MSQDQSIGSYNFNSKTIWNEIENLLIRISKYLEKNKIGQAIKEVISFSKQEEKNNKKITKSKTMQEKFSEIFHLISSILRDNKSEETNSFFVEFFRLSALFMYSINEVSKALDILDNNILRINENLVGLEEEFHDKNLLIERDKMLINKAQILFWEDRIMECNEIINNRINYLKDGLADEYYLIKMTYFYSTLLSYKAWIYFYDGDDVEADKSFYLSLKLIKDLKNIMLTNFIFPDFKELHKRQIKLYDQYVNFLIYRDRKDFIKNENESKNNTGNLDRQGGVNFYTGQPNNYLLADEIQDPTELNLSAFKFLKEILKILSKQTKNINFFNEEIPESLLIYYNLLASYFCLSVIQDDKINLENVIYYFMQTYITNNRLNTKVSSKINLGLLKKLISVESLIIKYGKILNISKLEMNEILIINKIIKKIKSLIVLFEDENISTMISKEGSGDNIYFQKILDLEFDKNQAEINILKFSTDNKKKPIYENINEIFCFKYIFEKFNYVLACNILQDKKLSLNDQSIVIEGLNGYLIAEENQLILIIQNTVNKNPDKVFGMNINNFENEDGHLNLFFELITLKSNEYYFIYYTKIVYSLTKENRLDIYGYLVMINFYMYSKLYKPAIILIQSLLREMVYHSSIEEISDKNYAFYQLYVFLSYLLVVFYFQLEDFSIAFEILINIANKLTEYNWSIYYLLMGVILSKKKFFDLSGVYFEKALGSFSHLITVNYGMINNQDQNENGSEFNTSQLNQVNEEAVINSFIIPIKMIISVTNMMKLKVITEFIQKIDLELEKKIIEREKEKKRLMNNNNSEDNEKDQGEGNDKINTIEGNNNKGYLETIIIGKNCYKCGVAEVKNEDVNMEVRIDYACTKCRRAFYCSNNCLKKDKYFHSKICGMYHQNFEKVNNLIRNYILQDKEK